MVNAQLDEALAVIHRIYTDSSLPIGSQQSTAEVEQELMELWSSVEKDKAAARERNQAARRQRLMKKVRSVQGIELMSLPATQSDVCGKQHSLY